MAIHREAGALGEAAGPLHLIRAGDGLLGAGHLAYKVGFNGIGIGLAPFGLGGQGVGGGQHADEFLHHILGDADGGAGQEAGGDGG
jgi:hypothetical protein